MKSVRIFQGNVRRRVVPLALVIGFGALGGYLAFRASAAVGFRSLEPEAGHITSGAVAIEDSSASGRRTVLFGAFTGPLFTVKDPAITESSGVAVSGEVYFTHNDSGDSARFFAIDGQGRTLATYTVPNVSAGDWEDMARGRDEAGNPSLFVGDIGDNPGTRPTIAVVRVREPAVNTALVGQAATAADAVRYRFSYPDGPRDAETLLVHPVTNRIYIVSKRSSGAALYEAPEVLSTTSVNMLRRAADISVPTATGGDFSPSGDRLVVRNYTKATVWQVPHTDPVAGVTRPGSTITLPPQPQGEAITFNARGNGLVITTEGQYKPVQSVTSPL